MAFEAQRASSWCESSPGALNQPVNFGNNPFQTKGMPHLPAITAGADGAGDRLVRVRGGRAKGDASSALLRPILSFAAALLFAAVFTGEAAAQCGGGGPFIGGPGPINCTTTLPTSTGNTQRSSEALLLGLGTDFMQRLGALSSFRTAASPGNNPQGGGADAGSDQRYRAWLEGYGLSSRNGAQDDFSGDRRKTAGGVAGAGVTIAPGITAGLSVDQSRTKIDVTDLPQSGTINLTQIGGIVTFEKGPWNLGTTLVHGFGTVHSSRFDTVGEATASYHAKLWAAMAELSYYVSLPNNSRFVPKISFDWTRSHTNAFMETGGATPVAGSSVTATRVRMLIGGELGHSWLLDRTIMDFAVYGKLIDNIRQNFGALQITDTTGVNLPAFVTGVPESNLGVDAGASLSAKLTDTVRIYAVYDGRFRSNFTSHGGTLGAEFRF